MPPTAATEDDAAVARSLAKALAKEERQAGEHWWTRMTSTWPACVDILEPEGGLAALDLSSGFARVQRVRVDDVMCGGWAPRPGGGGDPPPTFEVAEGSHVLSLPDINSHSQVCGEPPWLGRVEALWVAASDDARPTEPASDSDDERADDWEASQVAAGRLPARQVVVQLTYFYRWSDLALTSLSKPRTPPATKLVAAGALVRQGVAPDTTVALAMLEKRKQGGAGNAPAVAGAMRFAVLTDRVTRPPTLRGQQQQQRPGNDDGGDDDDDDAADGDPSPLLEAVMCAARVWYLADDDAPPRAPAAAPAAELARGRQPPPPRDMPPERLAAVDAARRALPDGFLCNLLLRYRGPNEPDELLTLSGWANNGARRRSVGGVGGGGGGRDAEERSRALVRQLLAESHAELEAAGFDLSLSAAGGGGGRGGGGGGGDDEGGSSDEGGGGAANVSGQQQQQANQRKRRAVLVPMSEDE